MLQHYGSVSGARNDDTEKTCVKPYLSENPHLLQVAAGKFTANVHHADWLLPTSVVLTEKACCGYFPKTMQIFN